MGRTFGSQKLAAPKCCARSTPAIGHCALFERRGSSYWKVKGFSAKMNASFCRDMASTFSEVVGATLQALRTLRPRWTPPRSPLGV
jgi:hypothetical protein